ncbi:hypothetical protein PR048_018772 [Dryococelus australis]|uniref:Uncharacterized protein n=1 Tax=Dryococelus australis TaxID=614101 RepID=A0ABQ9HDD1_9NEOP|nr:hypothetical protein PR048_018772 [Dryococelus australis]
MALQLPMRMAKIALEKFEASKEDWNSEGDDEFKNKKAILILSVGKVAYELLGDLCKPVKPADKSYSELISILHVITVRHKFHQCLQPSTEYIAQFVVGLWKCIVLKHFLIKCYVINLLWDSTTRALPKFYIWKATENMAAVSINRKLNISDPNVDVHKILFSHVQYSHNHHRDCNKHIPSVSWQAAGQPQTVPHKTLPKV